MSARDGGQGDDLDREELDRDPHDHVADDLGDLHEHDLTRRW